MSPDADDNANARDVAATESDARDAIAAAASDARDVLDSAAAKAIRTLLDRPTDPASDEAVAIIQALDANLTPELKKFQKNYDDFRRRGRWAILLLTISIVLLTWLSVTGHITAATANAAANRSESSQQAVYDQCVATNASRAGTRSFWINTILPIFASSSNSAAAKADIALVQNQVNIIYAAKNCNVLPHERTK
jgi:hypothetical protein